MKHQGGRVLVEGYQRVNSVLRGEIRAAKMVGTSFPLSTIIKFQSKFLFGESWCGQNR